MLFRADHHLRLGAGGEVADVVLERDPSTTQTSLRSAIAITDPERIDALANRDVLLDDDAIAWRADRERRATTAADGDPVVLTLGSG